MIILGINAYHPDSSACIVKDGQLVAAAEEERFIRIKHWAGFPRESIAYCLKEADIRLSDVDLQTDYLLNITELPEKKLMKIHSQMVVGSALNSLTRNKALQIILRPFFQFYWRLIKLNSSHIWWLRRATDLINWVIIKPIFQSVRKSQTRA